MSMGRLQGVLTESPSSNIRENVRWGQFNEPIYATPIFSDLNSDYWAKNEINYLSEKEIINGFPDGTFQPNRQVTRLQAVQMILKSKEIPIMNLKDPNLVDVDPKSYGYGYIAKAVELSIIHGKVNKEGEYYFDANGQLTRAQMAKVLSLAYELGGRSTYAVPDVTKNHWAYQHIQNLIGNKITAGYPNGDYGPNDPMTRAQFSVMMARILNNAFKVEGPTKPESEFKPGLKPVSLETLNAFKTDIKNNGYPFINVWTYSKVPGYILVGASLHGTYSFSDMTFTYEHVDEVGWAYDDLKRYLNENGYTWNAGEFDYGEAVFILYVIPK